MAEAGTDLDRFNREFRSKLENYSQSPHSHQSRNEFVAATVGYLMNGLEIYVAAAAKDRESAERDRQAMALDREKLGFWTKIVGAMAVVTAVATAIGVLRPTKPIIVPAPVVNVAAPAAPPPIVIPAPVVNVIVQPSSTSSPKYERHRRQIH